jgi:hypothetical protein
MFSRNAPTLPRLQHPRSAVHFVLLYGYMLSRDATSLSRLELARSAVQFLLFACYPRSCILCELTLLRSLFAR